MNPNIRIRLGTWKKIKLVGKTIFLRPIRAIDAQSVFRLANNPHVSFYLESFDAPVTLQKETQFVKAAERQWKNKTEFVFAICLKKTGELIGCCGLSRYNPAHHRATFGIWLGELFWGKGLGTQAAELAFRFGFEKLKLNRIKYSYLVTNKRSENVFKKLGLKKEGKIRQEVFKRGKFYDAITGSILASEWKKR